MASRSRSRSADRYDDDRSRSPTPRRHRSLTPRSARDYSREPSPALRDRDASFDRERGRSPPRRNGGGGGGRRSLSPPPARARSYSRGGDSRSRSRSLTRSLSPLQPVRSTKIVVERLTKNINENHLREIFGQFGEIEDLDLPLNRTCKLPWPFLRGLPLLWQLLT